MKLQNKQSTGFTIVETMIVLAIMGFLFISATILVTGEQNKTEFTAAIKDIQSVIQQHISEVGSGLYSNTGDFSCHVSGGAGSVVINNNVSGHNTQGTNSDCIFLGKAIQFGVKNTNPEQFITYTIAGVRDNDGSLAGADPTVVGPTTEDSTIPKAYDSDLLHNGLTVYKMTNGSIASNNKIGAVAFVSGLGSYGDSNQLLSGSQQVTAIPIKNTSINQIQLKGASDINHNLGGSDSLSPSSDGVQICFASGTTNQSGLITIGGHGRQLSVVLDIKDGRKCGL